MKGRVSLATVIATVALFFSPSGTGVAATGAARGPMSRPEVRNAVWRWWRGKYHPHIQWQRDLGWEYALVMIRVRFGTRQVHGVEHELLRIHRVGARWRIADLGATVSIVITG